LKCCSLVPYTHKNEHPKVYFRVFDLLARGEEDKEVNEVCRKTTGIDVGSVRFGSTASFFILVAWVLGRSQPMLTFE
jgi:hypothetical protein